MVAAPPLAASPPSGSQPSGLQPSGLQPSGSPSAGSDAAASNFITLQLNLCNGGTAPCYKDGLVIQEAVMTIQRQKPNLVSLNEICLGDLSLNRSEYSVTLLQAMRELRPSESTYSVFMPALKAGTDEPFKCTNGESYGSALMFHVKPTEDWGVVPAGFVYEDQLPTTTEWRTAACASVYRHFFACTTHLAAGQNAKPVALKQCDAMMGTIIPQLRAEGGVRTTMIPVIVQGDFNLKYDDGDNDVQKCIPSGYTRKGDGDVQHIVASNDAPFVSTNVVGMTYTDHVGFLAELGMLA